MTHLALAAALLCLVASHARAAVDCPIERLAGRIHQITGDPAAVTLERDGSSIPAQPGTCLLYGDRLRAGLQAVATVETARETRHVGGNYDPSWEAPAPVAAVPDTTASLFARLFHTLTGPPPVQTSYMTGRGPQGCPPPRSPPPPLFPLDRLRSAEQQIGADLLLVAAAWAPSPELQMVDAQLRAADGRLLTEDRACLTTHLTLKLPPSLQPGDRLLLALSNASGATLEYRLRVVPAADLPQSPTPLPENWLLGAWRLAAAPPSSHLDGLARIETAPDTAYGARLILDAVWADRPF